MIDARIRRVVEAISDGERIDWASVRRRYTDPAAANYCTHLETISKIDRLAQERASAHKDVEESGWVSLLVAIALLQIAVGVVGTIAYREYTFVNALRFLTVLSFAGVGIVLRHGRQNARARSLGAVFVLRSLSFSRISYALFVDNWLDDVLPAGFHTRLPLDAWAPFFIWQFARRFPATTRFTLVDRIAIGFTRIAATVGATLFLISLWVAFVNPLGGFAGTLALNYEEGQRYSAILFGLGLPALAVIFMRARAASSDERARVRLFAIATLAGVAPTYIEVILEALFPSYTAFLRGSRVALTVMVTAVVLPLLALPLVTGYSVLVDRLLDITFVVRQGIRYLLAKWTLGALTLTPFALFISYVYRRRSDSVVDIVSDPGGGVLLALVACGCVLLAARTYLAATLDRWFDRRSADRTTVLARSGDALRLVRTRSELVDSLVQASTSALNAPAVVYFFDSGRQAYVPFGRGGLSLPAGSALATIMMQEPTLSVLRTDGEHSIARFLPHTERLWLGETNACALAPIQASSVDRPAGILACGPRSDAFSYSRDDERFVAALASSAGIALENLRLKSDGEERGELGALCVRCRRVSDYVDGRTSCSCGGNVQAASVPRLINGKFQVEALLGAGGMGVAYLASDVALNRNVAIKTLPAVATDAMARLVREARTMAALSHPNLATILGHESWRGTPILVCEYLPGGTLQQRLAHGPLPTSEALALGLTLLDALEYMHGEGVLHRDIKPSNIAFASDRTPKLLDFGLAGLLERTDPTAAGSFGATAVMDTRLAGTLAYMPPQAFQGAAPDVRFDLWGLAVVLFEALTGVHPFAAGPDTAQNICRGRFLAAPDIDDTSGAVGGFLRQALSPNVHRQYESSSAMREALNAARLAFTSERYSDGR